MNNEHNNSPAVPQTVYLVENRTCLLAYASREDADKAVASMPASVGGGFLVSPVQVFGAPAPAPAQEAGLTDDERQQVFRAAENRMVREINLSWRTAVVDEVIAALRAKGDSHA